MWSTRMEAFIKNRKVFYFRGHYIPENVGYTREAL